MNYLKTFTIRDQVSLQIVAIVLITDLISLPDYAPSILCCIIIALPDESFLSYQLLIEDPSLMQELSVWDGSFHLPFYQFESE